MSSKCKINELCHFPNQSYESIFWRNFLEEHIFLHYIFCFYCFMLCILYCIVKLLAPCSPEIHFNSWFFLIPKSECNETLNHFLGFPKKKA